jgi:hypothetical protein
MTKDSEYGLQILDSGRTFQKKSDVETVVMKDIKSASDATAKLLRSSLEKFFRGDFNNVHNSFTVSRQVSGLRYDIMMGLKEMETAGQKIEEKSTNSEAKRTYNFHPGAY